MNDAKESLTAESVAINKPLQSIPYAIIINHKNDSQNKSYDMKFKKMGAVLIFNQVHFDERPNKERNGKCNLNWIFLANLHLNLEKFTPEFLLLCILTFQKLNLCEAFEILKDIFLAKIFW